MMVHYLITELTLDNSLGLGFLHQKNWHINIYHSGLLFGMMR